MTKYKSIANTYQKHKVKINYSLLAICFIVIGVIALVFTRAASTSFTALEPEIKAKGSTDIYNSTSASGQSYVRFSQNTPVSVTNEVRTIGPLSSELNVASNGSWVWSNASINASGADAYKVTMNAPTAVSSSSYFWSSSFVWSNKRDSGGYIGLQTKVFPLNQARGVIFSVWNTTVAESIGSGIAKPFDGEGVGMQTAQRLNWGWNTDYEMYVSKIADRSDATYNWWIGYARDTNTNIITEIGRIRTPTSWGNMIPNNNFLERYGASNTCGSFEPANGEFKYLKAKYGGQYYSPASVKVEIRQYTDCVNVVSSAAVNGGYRVNINKGN